MGFCGTKSDAMSVEDGVLQNECYVDVLNIIPHAVLQLVSIFILTVWNHSVIGKLKVKTWVHYEGHDLRWVCTLVLMVVLALEIVEGILSDVNDSDDSTNYHAFVPPCMAFVGTFLSIIFYHNVEMWNSPRFLLVLLFYWPLAVTLKCLKTISMHRNHFLWTHLKVWLVIADIILYLLLFLIELNVLRCQRYSFFKKSRRKRPPADLENTRFLQPYVNFLSKVVYWWVNDLLVKGFRRPLCLKDLGKLPQSEKASKVYKKVQMIFEEEKLKSIHLKTAPSLVRVLLKASWPAMFAAGFLKLFGDLLSFVGPLLIERIVDYAYNTHDPIHTNTTSGVSTRTGNKTHTYIEVDKVFSNGYVLAVVLLVSTLLHHCLLQNHFYLVIREGVRMRTAIQTMIYSKTLRLSNLVLSSGSTTQGQIINHMSIDSTFIMYLYFFIHYVWAVPLQVTITLALMYYKLGIAALIGGLCVLLAAPFMYLLGVGMSRLQKKILMESDKRVKKINEVIQGIKVIKLLAWERGFFNSVIDTRGRELRHLWPVLICRAFVGFLGISSPVIGTLMTFVLHPVLEDEPLSAGAAMSVLALLNLLQGPLQIMTILSATIANARVSSKRLLPFLLAEEVGKSHDSLPSFSKSCSIGFDSGGASGHATVDKLDSLASLDGKLPAIELQSLDDKSCLSTSNVSVRIPLTPTHSRHNSGSSDLYRGGAGPQLGAHSLGQMSSLLADNASASHELLDVKFHSNNLHRKASAPALGGNLHTSGDLRRKRHNSNRSMDEDETPLVDDPNLSEMHSHLEVLAGFFSWDLSGEEVALRDISIKIPTGKLTMIVGQVGSGKSSLLSAMLGEMTQVSGNIHRSRLGHTSTAYVSQKAWLLNATLKDNILFGKPYVLRKYKRAIAACSLQIDIDMLPAGDNTEIGEKGVNLSGGQKQRVSLARALYSEADFVILDDPLSALDSQVGKHVMEEAILKRLVKRNRTVVMVTHHLQYLSHAYQVVVMSNGHVHFHGKVSEVKKFDPDLYEVWRKAIREAKAAEFSQKLESGDCLGLERKHSGGSQSQLSVPGLQSLLQSGRKLSAMSVMTEASNEGNQENGLMDGSGEEQALKPVTDSLDDKDRGRLVKAEHREVGAVSIWVYLYYLKACSIPMCVLTIIAQFCYHLLMIASHFWLSEWASDASTFTRNLSRHAATTPPLNGTLPPQFDTSPYLPTFIYLSLSAVCAILMGCLVAYHTGYLGSKNIFLQLLGSVMHLPLRFFDTNPSGRIMNRFSSDITNVDQRIVVSLEQFLRCMFFTMSAVAVNCVINPYFCFGAIPFFVLYYCIQRFFRTTSRELQRLDSVTKSFVFSHLSETLEGLDTIRAFGVQSEFKRKTFKAIDSNVAPFLFIQTANRWLGIRLDFMSCLLVFIAAIASLSASSITSPALVGLCIAYALMVSGQLNWIVRTSAEVEMSMNAVERIMEYTDEPMESSIIGTGPAHSVPDSWPSEGRVEFQCVTLSYDIELEPVLHNASFVIQGGEKIGVCGRTGSGKSSTTLALFRLLEIMDGSILIDDLDISLVELVKLRSRLAIIPQDPVLFNESVRFNLDPTNLQCDEKIWSALEQVQMKETISALPGQLDAEIVEKGENLSMGQRQLLCLARAFLRDCKIVVMDEATASIDPVTDVKIQDIVHSPLLADRTIITIAHRLSTIIKYDKVLVLDAGRVVEFDAPAPLLADESSVLYRLAHSTSDQELK